MLIGSGLDFDGADHSVSAKVEMEIGTANDGTGRNTNKHCFFLSVFENCSMFWIGQGFGLPHFPAPRLIFS
jgi:hypothetical protein